MAQQTCRSGNARLKWSGKRCIAGVLPECKKFEGLPRGSRYANGSYINQMTVYMVVRMGYMSDMMTREGGAGDEGGATRWEMEVVADGVRLREKDARWVQQLYDGTHVPVRVWSADHARSTEHVVIWRGHVVGQEAEPGGGRSREDER